MQTQLAAVTSRTSRTSCTSPTYRLLCVNVPAEEPARSRELPAHLRRRQPACRPLHVRVRVPEPSRGDALVDDQPHPFVVVGHGFDLDA